MPLLLAAALLMTSGVVSATPEKPEKAVKERKICKREVDTRSRMGNRKTCRTYAEWKAGGMSDEGIEALQVVDKAY